MPASTNAAVKFPLTVESAAESADPSVEPPGAVSLAASNASTVAPAEPTAPPEPAPPVLMAPPAPATAPPDPGAPLAPTAPPVPAAPLLLTEPPEPAAPPLPLLLLQELSSVRVSGRRKPARCSEIITPGHMSRSFPVE